MSDYSSKFEITSEDKKSSNYTIVSSKVKPSDGGPEIKNRLENLYEKSRKTSYKDLIVEGLSLARTQKEEFASILSSNNDIKQLIIKLEDFVNK